ncbi:MAG: heavy metal translocating P-type ATPase [Erysipelothrix sp.]|nr:heavy metal translocating P-type ATPase [Erysipelothrix sp.]
MSKTVKISMEVKNLDCANCALKIENEISQLDGVQLVSLNLMSDTLKIILDEKKKTEILKQSQLIADRVEPGTKFISREETDHQESKVDIELIKLLVSISLFILGIFTNGNLQLSFFVASYLISGYKVLLTALKNLKSGVIFDENFLMSIATMGAFSIGEPLEAAAVMVFYNVGEYLQHKAVTRSKKNILDLLDNRNMVIHRLENGVLQDIDLNDVQVDDVLEIRVGEKIPVDGYIIQSETSLDTKAITGESLPVYVQPDSYVVSGSINLDRVVLMKASTTYQNSTTAQIVEAMKEASDKRADTEKMIGKFARIYTPIVVLIATIIA